MPGPVTESDGLETVIRSHVYPEGGTGWHRIPELPVAEELMATTGKTPSPNRLNTASSSKDEYLRFQYRILRHEGVEPLRRAVQDYKSAPDIAESPGTCIYTEVFVRGANIIRLGAMVRVTFSAVRSRQLVNWPASQRLVPGTVVALSPIPDNFQRKCIVAVVTGRYDEAIDSPATPPPLDLEIRDPEVTASIMEPDQEYVMIEARSNYFEAVRYVMEGLKQTAKEEPACLSRYRSLLDISSLYRGADAKIGPLKIPIQGDIPEHIENKTGLDGSQLMALQRMITKELAIVQGPPGTGKTHTSMAALKVLLSTQPVDVPIIITAQKNDTVDELLSRCHREGVSFIRLGGQAKDDAVFRRTLFNLRAIHRGKARRRDQFQKRLDFLKSQAKILLQRCFPPFRQQLILPEHLQVVGLITLQQCASIMVNWTGSLNTIAGEVSRHPFGPWLGNETLTMGPHRTIHMPFIVDNGGGGVLDPEEGEHNSCTNVRKEQLSGKPILISRWLTMKITKSADNNTEAIVPKLLANHDSLWDIPTHYRGMVYQHLEQRYVASTRLALMRVFEKINDITRELKVVRWQEDIETIQESGARIIGCTTTGLTKYRGLIAAMQPRVMMIEEAAETREANITAALFPTLQQIILVGDHMQLAPHADVLELSKPPFNLNVSLFQRLVERGIEYSSLQIQRRMVPEIRRLLSGWYPLLVDHDCTRAHDAVPGMGSQRLLWFDHQQPESANRYASKFNTFEAGMVVGLYNHLVFNGTRPSDITVLTFYSGQKTYIENVLRRKCQSRGRQSTAGYEQAGPEVQTVDGYQGKENEVILISVTRSPEDRRKPDAGFVKDLRRAIVALSRPRRLLVVFGDAQNLTLSSAKHIWGEVLDKIGSWRVEYIPIFCEAHGTEIHISHPDQWEKLAGPCRGLVGNSASNVPSGPSVRSSGEDYVASGLTSLTTEEDLLDLREW
ncbi:dead box helicase [Colletotrichum kahawae]|uniref:Dead box helicase n=1 Tax=Colletotrichum kahawae TaxID=34407 RepID=A0AAD9YLN5_COLKA|nr:dead box helicase [Colletotrichum kahawae]